MRRVVPYENDVSVGLKKRDFLRCFKGRVSKPLRKGAIEYWNVKTEDGKKVYVYEWYDKNLYLTEDDKEIIKDKVKKCKETNEDEELNGIFEQIHLDDTDDTEEDTYNTDDTEEDAKRGIDGHEEDKIARVLEDISNMNYGINKFGEKIHENNLEGVLRTRGFKATDDVDSLGNGDFYIKEPNGAQNPPDFRIFSRGESLDIECKSCQKGYKPMWNASYPDSNSIYVYTNKTDNETILFTGEEVITAKVREIYEKYKRLNKGLHKEINEELKALSEEENPYGMQVYARNMFVQTRHLKRENKTEYKKRILIKIGRQ